MLYHGIPPLQLLLTDQPVQAESHMLCAVSLSSWGELSAADLQAPSPAHACAQPVQATPFMARPRTSWAPRRPRESSRRGT